MKKMLKILTQRSFAANRVRNLIAVLAIVLTAVLFTSVTTIAIGTIQSMKFTLQIQKGSKSDGDFQNMTAEQFDELQQANFIKKAGLRMPINFLTNSNRHNIDFEVLDEIQAELTFCNPSHGKIPQTDNEIVASDRALRDLGAEPEVGAEVTIEFTAHGKAYRMPMIVSGWYTATANQMSIMWAGTAFRDSNQNIFQYTYDQDREIAGTYWSDFIAFNTIQLQKKMNNLVYHLGGNPDNAQANNYLPANINAAKHQPPNLGMIVMVIGLVILFIFCGYLLIYNVFDIAVMQEIRRYGLYRTIGMSKRQIKELINRQAIWMSCIGIPIGLIIGFFIGKSTMPIIMNTFSTEYSNIAANVSPSFIIFLGAALLTALTVFLSTRKPIRAAANISPIEAFHYVESSISKHTSKKSALSTNLWMLSWSNLGRNKRRSIFIVLSLSLCVILLNCARTAAGSVDIEKQAAYMTRTDFSVVNTASTNGNKGFTLREEALKEQTIADISAQPGVIDGTLVYKNTMEDANITYGFNHTLTDRTFVNDNGLIFCFDENNMVFGLGNDGQPICNVYGMEETSIARMDLRKGETDAHILYNKMENREGILVGVQINRTDMSLYEEYDFVDVGELITIYKNGQPVLELPVLAKAAINGDDEEIGFTSNGTVEIGGDGLFLYMPTSMYKELYDDPVIYKYSYNVKKEQQDNMVTFLNHYMENVDTSINYLSTQEARESAIRTRNMIHFVGKMIGIIFGIAGVLNLINMIITTILTRRHEFATMQSIGMTNRQLTKMLLLESFYYVLGACIIGIILAAVLNLTLVKSIIGGIWYFTFRFTLVSAFITSIVLMIIAIIVPIVAMKLFHNKSIIEQLRIAD